MTSHKINTIIDSFEQVVHKQKQNTAYISENRILSYSDLNSEANKLARVLLERNVRPGDIVAVAMERGADYLISILAILKVGAAYWPINVNTAPDFQNHHIRFIGAKLHITKSPFANKFEFPEDKTLICDNMRYEIDMHDDSNLELKIKKNSLIYVIFTSGTTKEPKAIEMSNRVIANLISWQIKQIPTSRKVRVGNLSAVNFDVFSQEIFTTLLSGHALVEISEEQRMDPMLLMKALNDYEINILFTPNVIFQNLITLANERMPLPSTLEMVIVAGEALKISPQIKSAFKQHGNCQLVNQYGPSETHVVTNHVLDKNSDNWPDLPSIGNPIDKAKIYILNEELKPVVKGQIGEIYIAGPVLANGYYRSPELTSERFINDVIAKDNTLMYKTGDLGKITKQGDIRFIGRNDGQIKVKGHLVSLLNIEVSINNYYPGIQCVVTSGINNLFGRYIVAFIAGIEPNIFDQSISQLKQHLSEILPEYAIPSFYIKMDSIPMTDRGKVDYRKLPDPFARKLTTKKVKDNASINNKVANIIASELNITNFNLDANFFEIGFDSLSLTKLCHKLNSFFHCDLSVMDVFLHPSTPAITELLLSRGVNVHPATQTTEGDN